jgi:Amt family ammonium transporter
MEAIAIGVGAGLFCYLFVRLRAQTQLDDSLDVVGVHGIGGTWGALATGLFATAAISGVAGLDRMTHGRPEQIVDQLIAIGAVWGYSFVVTMVILKVLDVTMGLRVKDDDEVLGLDISQHGERAYVIEETVGGMAAPTAVQAPVQAATPTTTKAPAPSGGGGS